MKTNYFKKMQKIFEEMAKAMMKMIEAFLKIITLGAYKGGGSMGGSARSEVDQQIGSLKSAAGPERKQELEKMLDYVNKSDMSQIFKYVHAADIDREKIDLSKMSQNNRLLITMKSKEELNQMKKMAPEALLEKIYNDKVELVGQTKKLERETREIRKDQKLKQDEQTSNLVKSVTPGHIPTRSHAFSESFQENVKEKIKKRREAQKKAANNTPAPSLTMAM